MKDGRTHLAHKAEHAIDLETGAIVGVTVQSADTKATRPPSKRRCPKPLNNSRRLPP
jgi:hypothetical protein